MTPPLCVGCQVQPVKRARRNEAPSSRGPRVDALGRRWRWFCSRACGCREVGVLGEKVLAGAIAWRQQTDQRRLGRFVAACRQHATPEGLVPMQLMVKLMLLEVRAAYNRGLTNGRKRLLHGRRTAPGMLERVS